MTLDILSRKCANIADIKAHVTMLSQPIEASDKYDGDSPSGM